MSDESPPSGQIPVAPGTQRSITETFAQSAIQALIPTLREDIVPMVLRDRNALSIIGRESGRGIVMEAGAWGAVAAGGVGLLGLGVALWGTSHLVRALRKEPTP